MAASTGISWTDSTWNPWWGCQKVGPGCDHCYAEGVDKRSGGDHWGAGAERRRTSENNWNEPLGWQKRADAFEFDHKHRRRVFCGSMMDIVDNAVPLEWAHDAFTRIAMCDRLDWQLLTKRVGMVESRVPAHWTEGSWPKHVGLMITVVDQKEADRDIPKLLGLKEAFGIPWVGLSMEPLLGPVNLTQVNTPRIGTVKDGLEHPRRINALTGFSGHYSAGDSTTENSVFVYHGRRCETVDWIITGGESGPGARPGHPDWYRSLRDQAAAAGVPFFFKQWGEWCSVSEAEGSGMHHYFEDGATVRRIGSFLDPKTLDAVTHHAFPRALERAHA